jgi:hypothetical protein
MVMDGPFGASAGAEIVLDDEVRGRDDQALIASGSSSRCSIQAAYIAA